MEVPLTYAELLKLIEELRKEQKRKEHDKVTVKTVMALNRLFEG